MTPEILQALMDSMQVAAETAARLDAEYRLQIITAILAAITTLGVAYLGVLQNRTHKTFNSKMDKFMAMNKAAAFAEGQKQEKEDQAAKDVDV